MVCIQAVTVRDVWLQGQVWLQSQVFTFSKGSVDVNELTRFAEIPFDLGAGQKWKVTLT